MTAQCDVAVLGGGPGGYAVALRAAARGLRVVIVEEDLVGGTCLHRGCVPSKALLHVGRLADDLPHMVELGLASPGAGLDLAAAARFRDGVVGRLHGGLQALLKARKVEVVKGRGSVRGPGLLQVRAEDEPMEISARHIVVATGSGPAEVPGLEVDHRSILTSDDALRLERVPQAAVIVGAGAVGVEFASLWNSLGASVTLLEMADRILPTEDPDSSSGLARALERRGIALHTGAAVGSAVRAGQRVVVETKDGLTCEADQVLSAVGRQPSTTDLGLQELDVLDERGYVKVDPWGRSTVDGLWAVGDVVPTLALAHVAFAEGFVVADAIAGEDPHPLDHRQAPRVTYCTPEVASVGLTEPEARQVSDEVRTTRVTLSGNARALIEGQSGEVKVVSDHEGILLGVHIVGPGATELINEAALATGWGALDRELAEIVHAHPTLSEAFREAALASAGLPFHAPSRL